MHCTGLAPQGDELGVRWVAIRHASDHIHIVATLARQDGGKPRIWNDFYRVREACQDAERRFGLRPTAPADRTAARRATRAETEHAARRGWNETPRYSLSFDGQFAAVTPHRTASSVVRQRRWRVSTDQRLAERLTRVPVSKLRLAAPHAPSDGQPIRPDLPAPQAGRCAGRAIRTLPGPVRRGHGGRGCRAGQGTVRAVVACLAALVWPPAARRLARPGIRRSRLLRWTGPGPARTRRQARRSTPGRSR